MATLVSSLLFSGTNKITDSDRDLANDKEKNNAHVRNKYTDQSNIRVFGGKAAGPKPIKANYDADDARIVDLKQQGYTDEYVARQLVKEDRIRYCARTVGSRWLRLRKALEAKEEEILEDEFSDWHNGEDERLEQAVKAIDEKIEKEMKKLQAKKWAEVALHVADLIQKKKYTPKLCHERYDALMDGTALKPIELDSDQEGRREMRNARRSTNRRLREEAAAAAEFEEQQKAAAKAAQQESKAANVAIKITKAQQKKINDEKIAKMKKEAMDQRKAQRQILAQWAAYNKAEGSWLTLKKRAEVKLCNKLLGLPASYRTPKSKIANDEDKGEMTDRITDEEDANDEQEDDIVVAPQTGKHRRSSGSASDNPVPTKKRGVSSATSSPRTRSQTSKAASPKHLAAGEAAVTDETRASMRSVMTLAELDAVLARRDLPKSTNQETQEQVVARLYMEDNMATGQALNDALKASGLETKGNKADKIQRLQAYDVSRSAAGEQ